MIKQVEMVSMSVSTFFCHKKFLNYFTKIEQKIIVPK
jgi:hypothetical protein